MERPKNIIFTLLLMLLFFHATASFKTEIYQAFISNDMNRWKKVIDKMNYIQPRTDELRLELLNYQYGYIGFCIGNKQPVEAKKYLALAEENLAFFEKSGKIPSLMNAYKSAFYGYKVGLNKIQAPFLGPKSVQFAKTAVELDDKNPYGYIQIGNAEFYMPEIFGGSKKKALEYYLKAEKLMLLTPGNIQNDWNYLGLLVMIVQCYKELKQYQMAEIYCEKALKTEPEYLWVKIDLLPKIKNLIKNQQ